MSYLGVIKVSIFVFPFVCILLSLPFLLFHYRKYGSVSFLRCLLVFSFFFYLLCAYFMVILPLPSRTSVASYTRPYYNLKPFFVLPEIILSGDFNITNPDSYIFIFNQKYFEPLFNILLTIPFGVYLKYYFNCGLLKTVFLSFILSLFFELTQLSGLYFIYPRPYRLCDVNDLINNTFGGFVGFVITPLFSFFLPTREKIDSFDYKRGSVVSVFRQGVSLIIDYFFIFLFVFTLYYIFSFNHVKFIYLILNFLVFVIVPVISSGYTFGKWFLKFKNVSSAIDGSISFVKYFIRWLLLHILILNGWIIILLFNNSFGFSSIYIWLTYFAFIAFFLVYIFNCLIVRKDIFINDILGISSVSIIGLEGDDDEI